MGELKSNAEWRQWGKDDPLWGVASWANKQKSGACPWTEEEFYALGESDWSDCIGHWLHYGLNTANCLEIGCGAGRFTKQLAISFDRVYAVDVSDEMISQARKVVKAANVKFEVVDGLNLPQGDQSVSAIFSTHVLQHLDSEEIGILYFGEFYRVLDAGGTLMVHLPVYQFPKESGMFGSMMTSLHGIYRSLGNIKQTTKRYWGVKTMRGTPYSIKSLTRVLSDLGFNKIEFRIFPMRSNGDPHPFVFATKSNNVLRQPTRNP